MSPLQISGDDIIKGLSLALGNFDGVHLGHKAVLHEAESHGELGVVSFTPNPKRFFDPNTQSFELMSQDIQMQVLMSEGASAVQYIRFDAGLVELSPEEFIAELLNRFSPLHITIGEDFKFGKNRRGNVELLKNLCAIENVDVTAVPLLDYEGEKISSTRIRQALKMGNIKHANQLLGRSHLINGIVTQGDQRGRDLGFPTANLYPSDVMLPKFGIYATRLHIEDGAFAGTYLGASSLGVRPSFGINQPNFETHILDFDGDIYGREITVELIEYLRPELKFEGIDALIAQMKLDVIQCREILNA